MAPDLDFHFVSLIEECVLILKYVLSIAGSFSATVSLILLKRNLHSRIPLIW
jgi:hypothetical protein